MRAAAPSQAPADPSPAGEGGRRAAPDGWGGSRTTLDAALGRSLRKRMTPHEVKLWNWLREAIVPAGFRFRRQVPIDRFVVDFACLRARLVVEVDGEQHGAEPGRRRDEVRDARLSELGYRVLRFSNRQVDREKRVVLDGIFEAVASRCEARPTPLARRASRPSPPGEGSGASHA